MSSKFVLRVFALSFLALPLEAKTPTPQVPVLSLITVYESQASQVYNWWAETEPEGSLRQEAPLLLRYLPGTNFVEKGGALSQVPVNLRKTILSSEERMELTKKFQAFLVVQGDVQITPQPHREGLQVRVSLQAEDLKKRQAQVVRIYELAEKDLSRALRRYENPVQLAMRDLIEKLKNPVVPVPELELVVTGPLDARRLRHLKERLQKIDSQIVSLREVSYENEQVVLALQYKGRGTPELRQKLENSEWGGWRTQVVSHNEDKIFFDVKTSRVR